MKRQMFTVLSTGMLLLATACNPVDFNQLKNDASIANSVEQPDLIPDPVPDLILDPIDPPSPPVIVVPAPVLTKGACASDSSTQLLSCMTCVVPTLPPAAPQFSKKGEAFFEIMTAACQVPNRSDPAGYVPPTRAALLRRLNRLSPTLYPDSVMTPSQISTINNLLANPVAIRSMFGGIFYSGVNEPTTAFETYFGLETIEARYAFCYASAANGTPEGSSGTFSRFNTIPLHSKAWVDCQYSADSFNCRENAAYTSANAYRHQLRSAMNESIRNPYVAPPAGVAKACEWEKFEGLYDASATAQVQKWIAAGFKVGGDVPSRRMCMALTGPLSETMNGVTGLTVSLAAYRCK